MHPSAFIISDKFLAEKVPLTLSETGEVMSQYDMTSLKDLGLLKIDLIGSLSLSLISDVSSILKRERGIDLDISDTGHDDPKVFNIIMNGNTLGKGLNLRKKEGIHTFRWKHPPKSWWEAEQPIFVDLNDGYLFLIKKVYPNIPCGGWGIKVSEKDFLKQFK